MAPAYAPAGTARDVPRAKAATVDYGRLCRAFKAGRQALEPYRQQRLNAVREFAASSLPAETQPGPTPINLLGSYVRIVLRSLVSHEPRVMVNTFRKEFKPLASAMESWANKELERMGMADTLTRWALDALFGVGIMKVCLAHPGDAACYKWNLSAGQPYATTVDLDDYVCSMNVHDFRQLDFAGHRFRMPAYVIRESRLYNWSKSRGELPVSPPGQFNAEGDERIGVLGRGYQGSEDELDEMVDCWEIYVPSRRLVLTYVADQLGGGLEDEQPIRTQEWLGPDYGPYHYLAFGKVPGNLMPAPPIPDLMPLHKLANNLYTKLAQQAERQKTNTFVRGVASEDGNVVMEGNDGEILKVENPEGITQVSMGGPHAANLQFLMDAVQRFSWLAGNLDAMGGLSPQAKTATQDKMLEANSTKTVQDMQQAVLAGVRGVYKALFWYFHKHPQKEMKTVYQLPGLPEFQLPRRVTPAMRQQVPFEDLELLVDPYSMPQSSPEQQLQVMNTVIQNVVLPLMPLLQQQGVYFDVNAYLAAVAKFGNLAVMTDFVKITEPPTADAGAAGGGERPGMAPNTRREYVRESRSSGTGPGQNAAVQQALLGQNPGGSPGARNGSPRMVGAAS